MAAALPVTCCVALLRVAAARVSRAAFSFSRKFPPQIHCKMAALLETSAGEIVIDLFCDDCPLAATNFLKLCKIKFYNGCLFYNVQPNYICQTGDPTGTGKGGNSVYGLLHGDHASCFADEIMKHRKMNKVGLVCMAHDQHKENANRSQFFITLRGEDLDNLEGKYTIFGEVAEGFDVLQKINELYCDGDGRPYQDIRIKHTYVLDDPFLDPTGLVEPPSPVLKNGGIPDTEIVPKRIPYEEGVETEVDSRTEAELEESIRKKEAQSRAIVLEMTGDIPDADIKPPDEVLFVCKLNPITTDADLELIFSRFGKIKQCEIIRDNKTGDSLNYAFIEFETEKSCIEAYEKMNNVLIDDRRIKVDFSQSVSKLWNRFAQRPRATGQPATGKPTMGTTKPSHYGSNTGAAGGRPGRFSGQPILPLPAPMGGGRYDSSTSVGSGGRSSSGGGDSTDSRRPTKQPVERGRDGDGRSRSRADDRDKVRDRDRETNRRSRSRDGSRDRDDESDRRKGGRDGDRDRARDSDRRSRSRDGSRDRDDERDRRKGGRDGSRDRDHHRRDSRSRDWDRDKGHERSRR